MATIESSNDQITLTCQSGGDGVSKERLRLLGDCFRMIEDVRSVKVKHNQKGGATVSVRFDDVIAPQVMLRRMAGALRGLESCAASADPGASVSTVCRGNPVSSAGELELFLLKDRLPAVSNLRLRVRRWIYGVLAVGAFGMAWVGLVVPGIPTVPFVILTAAFAAEADESLHRRLVNSRVIGPIMKDWEEHRAVRPEFRIQATLATLVIVGITLLVTPPSVMIYSMMAVMLTLSLYVVWKLPVIQDDAQETLPVIPAMTLSAAM